MTKEFLVLPPGYEHKDIDRRLWRFRQVRSLGRVGLKEGNTIDLPDGVLLSNRSWSDVDRYFGNLPSKAIKNLAAIAEPGNPLEVLDIGAGAQFRAAQGLRKKFHKLGDRLHVTGVDLAYTPKKPRDVARLQASFTQLPVADKSIDLAYSRASISEIGRTESDVIKASVHEAVRVLRPGGIFFLDGSGIARMHNEDLPDNISIYEGKVGFKGTSRAINAGLGLVGMHVEAPFSVIVNADRGTAKERISTFAEPHELHLVRSTAAA